MSDTVSYTLKSSSAQTLGVLVSILKKAKAHAAEHEIDETVLLSSRLFPTMLPFTRQIQMAADTVARGAARLAQLDMPSFPDTETSFDELIARLEGASKYVDGVDSAAIDANAQVVLDIPMGSNTMKMEGRQYLSSFVLPNVHFHAAIAYALLRAQGMKLGKVDFLRP